MSSYKEQRPWGEFEILAESTNYKIKQITVLPNKRLSLQSHKKRSEHWYIIKGLGEITLEDRKIRVDIGKSVDISVNTKHRVENVGDSNLVFIEIQTGESFEESDIQRYEDDFGRS